MLRVNIVRLNEGVTGREGNMGTKSEETLRRSEMVVENAAPQNSHTAV
jgi:hypothetical protein